MLNTLFCDIIRRFLKAPTIGVLYKEYRMRRILLVCHNLERAEEIIEKGVQVANDIEASITLLFIHEVELFNFFSKEEPFVKGEVWKQLKSLLSMRGREDAVVLVEEGDSADWVEQELEKEQSSLVIIDYVESVTAAVVERISAPCLVLKKYQQSYTKGVMATEISKPQECFGFAQRFVENIVIYMDSLVIPIPYVASPVVDVAGQVVDVELYEEMLEQRKEELEEFCKEQNLECNFDTGDDELSINILSTASEKGADLLIISAIDNLSQLGTSIESILERATVDVLVCERGFEKAE